MIYLSEFENLPTPRVTLQGGGKKRKKKTKIPIVCKTGWIRKRERGKAGFGHTVFWAQTFRRVVTSSRFISPRFASTRFHSFNPKTIDLADAANVRGRLLGIGRASASDTYRCEGLPVSLQSLPYPAGLYAESL